MWADALQERGQAPGLRVEWPLGIAGRCVLVHGFLSTAECDALIAKGEQEGFTSASPDYPPSYRDNDRLVVDDPMLAQALFQRLMRRARELAAVDGLVAERGEAALGVNERIRFCRYRPGTRFGAHQDGIRYCEAGRSRLTFMVYLNDESFIGGDTVFFANRVDAMAGDNPLVRLRPRKGSLILFDHALWHAGARVDAGVKYVMRSDLMYAFDDRRDVAAPFQPGHRGYVWSLAALSGQRVASVGRDAVLRIWDRQGALETALVGHAQSVLGVIELARGELISYSRDRTVRRWCLETATSQVIGTGESAVLSGERLGTSGLVTGDAAGMLTAWDLDAGTATRWRGHASWIWGMAAIGDGTFATAAEDGWVRRWRGIAAGPIAGIELGLPLRTVAAHRDANAMSLAVGDIEGRVHLLDARAGLARTGAFQAHDGPVRKLRFEDGRHLLSCGEDGLVCRWDLASGTHAIIARHDNFASDVLPLGNGQWLSCGYDSDIRIGSLSQACDDIGAARREPPQWPRAMAGA